MTDYSVHDEPDFARVYDEDDLLMVRRGDLRALLDIASGSMDATSGFLNNEEVEILRANAVVLGIDPITVTPKNFVCQYTGLHWWSWQSPRSWMGGPGWWCPDCNKWDRDHTKDDPPTDDRSVDRKDHPDD
jgi:hypothetical protein